MQNEEKLKHTWLQLRFDQSPTDLSKTISNELNVEFWPNDSYFSPSLLEIHYVICNFDQ